MNWEWEEGGAVKGKYSYFISFVLKVLKQKKSKDSFFQNGHKTGWIIMVLVWAVAGFIHMSKSLFSIEDAWSI